MGTSWFFFPQYCRKAEVLAFSLEYKRSGLRENLRAWG